MNITLIFAGGTGRRMHSKDKPKQFLTVYGKPIIIHTIEHFEQHPEIDAIVVVCHKDWIDYFKELVSHFGIQKVSAVVPGGNTGQESIRNGLREIKRLYGDTDCSDNDGNSVDSIANECGDDCGKENAVKEDIIVLIHDGVRPLINQSVISDNIKCVKEHGNAITTGRVVETVIKIDDRDHVDKVYDREMCRLARAPQSFYLKDIWAAHQRLIEEGDPEVIDSAMLMARYGTTLHTIEGPSENIKVTTPRDFYLLQAYMQAKEINQLYEV